MKKQELEARLKVIKQELIELQIVTQRSHDLKLIKPHVPTEREQELELEKSKLLYALSLLS